MKKSSVTEAHIIGMTTPLASPHITPGKPTQNSLAEHFSAVPVMNAPTNTLTNAFMTLCAPRFAKPRGKVTEWAVTPWARSQNGQSRRMAKVTEWPKSQNRKTIEAASPSSLGTSRPQ